MALPRCRPGRGSIISDAASHEDGMTPDVGTGTPHPPLGGGLSRTGRGEDGAAHRSLLGSFCQIGATSPTRGEVGIAWPAHRLSPA